jgi:hypothetical protein
MNAPFITRQRAEAWRAAQPTPRPAQLQAFLDNEPRVLPTAPPPIDQGAYTIALYFLGAVAFTLLGWVLH